MLKKFTVLRRDDALLSLVKGVGIDLPAPLNISYSWKFGSLLFFFLFSQMMSGLLLAIKYIGDMKGAFESMDLMGREMWGGWIVRYLHMSGSSCFFLFLFCHMGRGIYYGSYTYSATWLSGVTILLVAMASAFLGYVLPWGQMSYWGATVITNFFSVIPYMGQDLVIWMWGSFSVDYPTLSRFFSLHFLFPLVLLAVVMMHVMYLHETGSNKTLGIASSADKIFFYPYFLAKDVVGFAVGVTLVMVLFFGFPWNFMEYQNFIQAKCLVTPPHIQPEWYFLAAYAVLRAMPSKLGGVIALLVFVAIYYLLPLLANKSNRSISYSWKLQLLFWLWVVKLLLLTWVGACPVEEPFVSLSRLGTLIYFLYFFIM